MEVRRIPSDASSIRTGWSHCVSFNTELAGIVYSKADTAHLAEAYEGSGSSSTSPINIVHPSASLTLRSAVAQSILSDGKPVQVIGFKMYKAGAPVGVLKAAIYAHTGTFGSGGLPTGAPIAVSDTTVAMEDMSTTVQLWYFFIFSTPVALTNGTNYCVVVYADSATTLNASNYVNVMLTSGGPHPGNYARFMNSIWSTVAGFDTLFKYYEDYTDDAEDQALVITPNTAAGFVIPRDTGGTIILDGVRGYGFAELASNSLVKTITVEKQWAGSHHVATCSVRYGWACYPDETCHWSGGAYAGYVTAVAGGTLGFTSDLGSKPVGQRYQWYLDGAKVGTDSSAYTAPAQTPGTLHTVHVAFEAA